MAEVSMSTVDAPIYKASHTFKIRNFDQLIKLAEPGKSFSSPVFGHPDTPVKWSIRLKIDGSSECSHGSTSVYLVYLGCSDLQARFRLSAGVFSKTDTCVFTHEARTMELTDFVAHKDLRYSEPGVFEVTATVEYVWGDPRAVSSVSQPPKAPDHSSLLFSEDLSDFSLVVEGQTIPVHKAFLASASPVFRAMFAQTGTREAESQRAVLQDTSVGAVKRLLRFVYTGSLDAKGREDDREKPLHEDKQMEDAATKKKPPTTESGQRCRETLELCSVLSLAHCYEVAGLGEAAEAALRGRLDKDSLLPIAAAADLYGFPGLFQLCREAVMCGRVELGNLRELIRDRPALACKLTAPTWRDD